MSTISVVIPTLNEEQNIGRLLSSLLRQSRRPDEILVVDAGSMDGTAAIASQYESVRVIQGRPPVGAQRQLGLENAAGDLVFFMDADTIAPPDFIAHCQAEMLRRRIDAACPAFRPFPPSFSVSIVYGMYNLLFRVLQWFIASGGGMCIITNRDFAVRIGGLRGNLVYEDIEFIRRASRRGRFRMIRPHILVSDRRFREYGVVTMLLQYTLLSFFFTFGLFRWAEIIRYPFGKYKRSSEEMVVLVNEKNEPTGLARKDKIHSLKTPLHRGFSLFVLNRRGEVLLQQRSETKQTWPMQWSNSCCGHPLPGEEAVDAARRRAVHELNLAMDTVSNVLPDYRYRAQCDGLVENETCPVLVGIASGTPDPNPAEVNEVRWVTWDELLEMAGREDMLTPWCREEVRLLNTSPQFHRILTEAQSDT
ncbi:MAG: isopentenyl-diphosphate Delta-isomerase [Armatimonadetes bacterium]|jgi:isopentenyl-diphosphate delta-isomerase|nr:isopentenyl-diphosphate Delta-isomerase [Armatimonadota bacterium]